MTNIVDMASLLALLAAACFGAAMVTAKFGLRWMDSTSGALVSIPSTAVLFWCLSAFLMDWGNLLSPAIGVFAVVGVCFPAMVTLLVFEANRRMGPTPSATISSIAPFFAIVSAILILGEELTLPALAGAVGIVIGVMALSWAGSADSRRWPIAALVFPLSAAAIRGLAQMFTKFGLQILPDPFTAGLVCYTVSVITVVVAVRLRYGSLGIQVHRRGVGWFMGTGMLNGTAVLSLYSALKDGDVVIVSPIAATFPLFTLAFSLLFLPQEKLRPLTIAGVILVVGGIITVVLSRRF